MASGLSSYSSSRPPPSSSSSSPLRPLPPPSPHSGTSNTDEEWHDGSIVDNFESEPRRKKSQDPLPDWDAWDRAIRDTSDRVQTRAASYNQADEDFFAALEKSAASASSLTTTEKQPRLTPPLAPPSPPMIDLRVKAPPATLDDADDWFVRFEKDPSTAMKQRANGSSRSSTAASAVGQDQLDSIHEARHSPMTFTPAGQANDDREGHERGYFARPVRKPSQMMKTTTTTSQSRQPASHPSSSWWGSIRGLGSDLARHAVDYLDPGVDFTDEELKMARKMGAVDISSQANTPSGSTGGTPLRSATPVSSAVFDGSKSTAQAAPATVPPVSLVSGAPGVNFQSLNPHWNTGSWSLSANDPGRLEGNHTQEVGAHLPSSSSSSPFKKRPLRDPLPVTLIGRREETCPAISGFHSSHIQPFLPPRMRLGKTWKMLYSSDQDGMSLETLYRKVCTGLDPKQGVRGSSPATRFDSDRHDGWLRGSSSAARAAVGADNTSASGIGSPSSSRQLGSGLTSIADAGLVLAIRDAKDQVFGSFVNEGLKSNPKGYYGSGDCFLWRTVQPTSSTPYVQIYPATLLNNYFVQSTSSYLSFGGGVNGKYGLWVDSSFEKGVSARCETFENDVLCDDMERSARDRERETRFEPVVVEIWAVGID